jgi:predicted phosphoadenosine phosphosulfate sulfurtransferase
MAKIYNENKNVYEASIERIKYCFDNFKNVLVAFSGGKDSGVMLNLAYDYAKKNNLLHKLAFFNLDYEAAYEQTDNYVEDAFKQMNDVKRFWLCLPIYAQCACSSFQNKWKPWDKKKKDIWVKKMPNYSFVINEDNCEFDYEGLFDYDVQDNFGTWFAGKYGKTATLIGIRTDESLNRFRAIKKENVNKINQYINHIEGSNTYKVYPIYDWTTQDIWVYNAKFNKTYNSLYDMFYKCGITIDKMRVASPFNDCAIDSLKLFKVINPNNWGRMIGRVDGVNFSAIYGGTTAMGWRKIKLPKGHTWKSYLNFLLNTLPEETRNNYKKKLDKSIEFWASKGGCLDDDAIKDLERNNIEYEVGKSNYSDKKAIKIKSYIDDIDSIYFNKFPSYKRMCVCILKNDHFCKYMGFSQTKKETEKRKKAIAKYKGI